MTPTTQIPLLHTPAERPEKTLVQRERVAVLMPLARYFAPTKSRSQCGYAISKSVGVGISAGHSGMLSTCSLGHCGNVWSCPSCSAKIARTRADELSRLFAWWRKGDVRGTRQVAMITLTVRHRFDESGDSVWDRISAGWRAITQDWRYKEDKKSGFVHGVVRVAEATHGKSGWHVHLHCAVLLDEDMSNGRDYTDITRSWWRCWRRGCWQASGGDTNKIPSRAHGIKVDLVPVSDLKSLADYITKTAGQKAISAGLAAAAEKSQRQEETSAARELTMSGGKAGRNGNRVPFEILRSMQDILDSEGISSLPPAYGFHGEKIAAVAAQIEDDSRRAAFIHDAKIWGQWLVMSQGRRQIVWSRGLKDEAAITEVDDENAANVDDITLVDDDSRLLGGISASDWTKITSQGSSATFLSFLESEILSAPISLAEAQHRLQEICDAQGWTYVDVATVQEDHKNAVEKLTKAERRADDSVLSAASEAKWSAYVRRYTKKHFGKTSRSDLTVDENAQLLRSFDTDAWKLIKLTPEERHRTRRAAIYGDEE